MGMQVSGVLCKDLGWEYTFYVFGKNYLFSFLPYSIAYTDTQRTLLCSGSDFRYGKSVLYKSLKVSVMSVGALGVLCSILWFFLVFNSPAEHPRISAEERDYIEKALNTQQADEKVIL